MARWQPGARERLVVSAVELFADQGYDATTVAEITERAGVTKSTFFRHFPDKRELLSAGQALLSQLLAEGISAATAEATPLGAVAVGLQRASEAFGPMNREIAPQMKAAIASSAELQEREALKRIGLSVAMTEALVARGFAEPVAHLAAEMGVLAFKQGYAAWVDAHDGSDFGPHALAALETLREASSAL
ncbi:MULTISPECIES: TetR/AcrR family transcriptional regulator [unclassified Nocardioides]|uniref:TetR/AcrR family transcriptional regulator n=1 Tax=unclassified Nocardioides TaxID=2615069 RepID=UPI000702DFC4|nr:MULTISPECIES: TetR/AcrR family transcriptional regulator [unclassified Nocardioides]KRC48892.1 TetR family transcriptional regulator [Nocardioides sp. Root79]KRC75291.1 TetR family transcriptional regulator [Nocardioides sp. Root240]